MLKAGYLSQPGHVKAADALPRSAGASTTERRSLRTTVEGTRSSLLRPLLTVAVLVHHLS